MNRERILYRGVTQTTTQHTFQVNSEGVGSQNHVVTGYSGGAEVTITFVDGELQRVDCNFNRADCHSLEFWFEIQAAIADKVRELQA